MICDMTFRYDRTSKSNLSPYCQILQHTSYTDYTIENVTQLYDIDNVPYWYRTVHLANQICTHHCRRLLPCYKLCLSYIVHTSSDSQRHTYRAGMLFIGK